MRCFPEEHAPVLSWLAKQFAVLVNWYASVPGGTWPNRNFAHAAQAGPLTARDEAAADVLAGLPLLPTVRTDCTRIEQPVEVRIADLPRAPTPNPLNDFQASLLRLGGAVKTQLEQMRVAEVDAGVAAAPATRPPFEPDRALDTAAKARVMVPGSPASQAVEDVVSYFA